MTFYILFESDGFQSSISTESNLIETCFLWYQMSDAWAGTLHISVMLNTLSKKRKTKHIIGLYSHSSLKASKLEGKFAINTRKR